MKLSAAVFAVLCCCIMTVDATSQASTLHNLAQTTHHNPELHRPQVPSPSHPASHHNKSSTLDLSTDDTSILPNVDYDDDGHRCIVTYPLPTAVPIVNTRFLDYSTVTGWRFFINHIHQLTLRAIDHLVHRVYGPPVIPQPKCPRRRPAAPVPNTRLAEYVVKFWGDRKVEEGPQRPEQAEPLHVESIADVYLKAFFWAYLVASLFIAGIGLLWSTIVIEASSWSIKSNAPGHRNTRPSRAQTIGRLVRHIVNDQAHTKLAAVITCGRVIANLRTSDVGPYTNGIIPIFNVRLLFIPLSPTQFVIFNSSDNFNLLASRRPSVFVAGTKPTKLITSEELSEACDATDKGEMQTNRLQITGRLVHRILNQSLTVVQARTMVITYGRVIVALGARNIGRYTNGILPVFNARLDFIPSVHTVFITVIPTDNFTFATSATLVIGAKPAKVMVGPGKLPLVFDAVSEGKAQIIRLHITGCLVRRVVNQHLTAIRARSELPAVIVYGRFVVKLAASNIGHTGSIPNCNVRIDFIPSSPSLFFIFFSTDSFVLLASSRPSVVFVVGIKPAAPVAGPEPLPEVFDAVVKGKSHDIPTLGDFHRAWAADENEPSASAIADVVWAEWTNASGFYEPSIAPVDVEATESTELWAAIQNSIHTHAAEKAIQGECTNDPVDFDDDEVDNAEAADLRAATHNSHVTFAEEQKQNEVEDPSNASTDPIFTCFIAEHAVLWDGKPFVYPNVLRTKEPVYEHLHHAEVTKARLIRNVRATPTKTDANSAADSTTKKFNNVKELTDGKLEANVIDIVAAMQQLTILENELPTAAAVTAEHQECGKHANPPTIGRPGLNLVLASKAVAVSPYGAVIRVYHSNAFTGLPTPAASVLSLSDGSTSPSVSPPSLHVANVAPEFSPQVIILEPRNTRSLLSSTRTPGHTTVRPATISTNVASAVIVNSATLGAASTSSAAPKKVHGRPVVTTGALRMVVRGMRRPKSTTVASDAPPDEDAAFTLPDPPSVAATASPVTQQLSSPSTTSAAHSIPVASAQHNPAPAVSRPRRSESEGVSRRLKDAFKGLGSQKELPQRKVPVTSRVPPSVPGSSGVNNVVDTPALATGSSSSAASQPHAKPPRRSIVGSALDGIRNQNEPPRKTTKRRVD